MSAELTPSPPASSASPGRTSCRSRACARPPTRYAARRVGLQGRHHPCRDPRRPRRRDGAAGGHVRRTDARGSRPRRRGGVRPDRLRPAGRRHPARGPQGFRSLLNSFLPRKRAISQLLIRSTDDRVLLCQLTYKRDFDLPGGVVEVSESPQLAVAREVEEELGAEDRGRSAAAHRLAAAVGWLGRRDLPGLRRRRARPRRRGRDRAAGARDPLGGFFTLAEVREKCADFTARRIESALRNLSDAPGPTYTESGRGLLG